MFKTYTNGATTIVAGGTTDLLDLMDPDHTPEHNRKRLQSMRDQLSNSSGWERQEKFGGLKTPAQAAAIFAAEGWQDGAERAQREIPTLGLSDLAPEAVARKRRRVYADQGDTVRIDAALAGNWERAFESRSKQTSRAPITLSVGCGFGASGNIDHDELFWSGVQMAALCDILEGAGWRIELRAIKANDFGSGAVHVQDWTVKQADQPLRLDTTLALFGHAGVYRTLGWSGLCATSHTTPSTYGTPRDGENLRKTFADLANAGQIPPLSLIIPQAYGRSQAVNNLRTALLAVREQAGVAA